MKIKGQIASWNDEKGFGFIAPSGGGKQIFFHVRALSDRRKKPVVNERVTYSLSTDKLGRPCAEKITRPGMPLSINPIKLTNVLVNLAPVVFIAFVGFSAFQNKIDFVMLPIYLSVSLFTFFMYALDKSAARSGSWRTQESTLHLFSIVGGWPGAMLAQKTLRHKSKKRSFRVVFWITVILNVGIFIWLHTPEGKQALVAIIGVVSTVMKDVGYVLTNKPV